MRDNELDLLKNFMCTFKSYDDFYQKYIKHYNLGNKDSFVEFFEFAKSNNEIWNMYKYFNSSETIKFNNETINDINDFVFKLKDYNLDNYKRIIIRLDNKTYDNIDELLRINKDILILVNGDKGLCTIDEFIRMREFFDYFKSTYSSYNLSEIEIITLAYDYVKFFKYNIEDNDSKTLSRSISKSLCTGYIVCEGYAKIFSQLLKEFNINSYLVYVSQNKDERLKHVRNIVYINDSKYDINGFYAFDPTWDSYKEEYTFSTISYLYYMISLEEYNDIFSNEGINRIVDYSNGKIVEFNFENIDKTCFSVNDLFRIIRKIKRVEGYSNNQIEDYINNIIYKNNIILRKNWK